MEATVADFLAAAVNGDVDAMMKALAPEARLESPVSGRMVIQGDRDLRRLLKAVFGTVRRLTWEPPIGEGSKRVAIGHMKIGPFNLRDATLFELDDDGRICRMRPHLGPLPAFVVFTLALGPKMAIHPGLLLRALRAKKALQATAAS